MSVQNSALQNAAKSARRSPRNHSVLRIIFRLSAIWSERRRLERLEPHQLNDLGLTADQAQEEARRAAWDAPERWRR